MIELWALSTGAVPGGDDAGGTALIPVSPGPHAVPCSTIAHATARPLVAALAELGNALARWPWVVPSLILSTEERHLEHDVRATFHHPERLAVWLTPSQQSERLADLIHAVLRRPRPSPRALAAFVSARIGNSDLEGPLAEQFSMATGHLTHLPMSRATYSRRFGSAGPLKPHNWRALAQLLYEFQDVAAALRTGASDIGHMLSTKSQRYARSYLPPAQLNHLISWEGILEHALRRFGYVALAEQHTHSLSEREREEEVGR